MRFNTKHTNTFTCAASCSISAQLINLTVFYLDGDILKNATYLDSDIAGQYCRAEHNLRQYCKYTLTARSSSINMVPASLDSILMLCTLSSL